MPVVLIASQVITSEIGIDFPQEVDFKSVYQSCSVFCEMLINPAEARRMTTRAAQAALTRGGVAVLIVPADISAAEVDPGPAYAVHVPAPLVRPGDAELRRIAEAINGSAKVAIYAGAGCEHAHDALVALCARIQAPMAHTSRSKISSNTTTRTTSA